MKIKTSELSGKALDFAAFIASGESYWTEANAEWDQSNGYTDWILDSNGHIKKFWFDGSRSRAGHWEAQEVYSPSTDWARGGPIIEREKIGVCHYNETDGWEVPNWAAWRTDIDDRQMIMGESALIASTRCYVQIKLGDEVDVPDELLR